MTSDYLTAREAAAALGVTRETLYAYVSRGWVRSSPALESRQRRYSRHDIEQLRQRKLERSRPHQALSEALHWGSPLCDSSITLIADGELYYRGRNALELARTCSYEQVVELLWQCDDDAFGGQEDWGGAPESRTFEALMAAILALGAQRTDAYDLRPVGVARSGVRIIRSLAATAAGLDGPGTESVAVRLARGWRTDRSDLIRTALILCADHELNVSAFTARCVASAGATPYAAVVAALGALSGTRHGGVATRVESLLEEVRRFGGRQTVQRRLRRGEEVAGFGHQLYPGGDPRARLLLDLVELPEPVQELIEAVSEVLSERPTIDLGLVAVCQAMSAPAGAAQSLFAVGRSGGWLAHVREQLEQGQLIRPRARYLGPRPGELSGG